MRKPFLCTVPVGAETPVLQRGEFSSPLSIAVYCSLNHRFTDVSASSSVLNLYPNGCYFSAGNRWRSTERQN